MTRVEARGCGFEGLEVGREGVEGGGGDWASLSAAESHAARAVGSMGHAVGGGSVGGAWMLLEEVFPMVIGVENVVKNAVRETASNTSPWQKSQGCQDLPRPS